jgi:hypothetical protein
LHTLQPLASPSTDVISANLRRYDPDISMTSEVR